METVKTPDNPLGERNCAHCNRWLPAPTQVPGCAPERICGLSKLAGYGLYGQDGRAVITPGYFGCVEFQSK